MSRLGSLRALAPRLLGSVAIGGILLVGGCVDPGAGALFAEIEYGTHCQETRGCSSSVDRHICGINNGDPCVMDAEAVRMSCSVIEQGATRLLTVSAGQGSDFSFAISQAQIAVGGGPASGSNCDVRLNEGVNRYSGSCGSAPPSEAQPCQISNITFGMDDDQNTVVEGDIQCAFLPNTSSPAVHLELSKAGGLATDMTQPGHFRLLNCVGLTL